MRFLLSFLILFVSTGTQILYSQSKKALEIHSGYKLQNTDYYIQIPENFVLSQKNQDEFICQEKGSVLKFAYIENVSTSTFCDSLTSRFFNAQQLTDVTHLTQNNLNIYKGKFLINEISYIRAFYVFPHKKSTVLGIANYPEKIGEEIEKSFIPLFNDCHHE